MNLLSLNRGYNCAMMTGIERRLFSELGDQQLLEQTRRLAANLRCLEVHILNHLDEIDRRGLALRRGFSSLFDYIAIGSIYNCYNGLSVTLISRYCFQNPLVVSDHTWFSSSGAVIREEPVHHDRGLRRPRLRHRRAQVLRDLGHHQLVTKPA